jgi:hypothetical protein
MSHSSSFRFYAFSYFLQSMPLYFVKPFWTPLSQHSFWDHFHCTDVCSSTLVDKSASRSFLSSCITNPWSRSPVDDISGLRDWGSCVSHSLHAASCCFPSNNRVSWPDNFLAFSRHYSGMLLS